MKITDPLKLFELEWNRKIEQIGSLEGPKGDKGDQGRDGKDGSDGKDGKDGLRGKDGIGITNVSLDKEGNLMVEYTTGEVSNVGKIFTNPTPSNQPLVTRAPWKDNLRLMAKEANEGEILAVVNNEYGFYSPLELGIGGGDEVASYTKLVDTDGQYKYIGEALPGTSESASSWRIKRIEFLTGVNDGDIEIKWANGSALFDRAWINRTTETYS